MDKRAPKPAANNDDLWTTLFELPETDYLDPELRNRFLDHPNPARDWLLSTAP